MSRSLLLAAALYTGCITGLHAQVAVVVAADTAVDQMSREQISAIFLGRSQQLPGGQRATPVESGNEALRERFSAKVLDKTPSQVKTIWSRLIFSGTASPPKEVPDSTAVKAFIATHPGAIGYIEPASVDSTLKVVLVEQ